MARILIIGFIALILVCGVRVFVLPLPVTTMAMSPMLQPSSQVLVDRVSKYSGKPLERYDIIAVIPPYLDGQSYVPAQNIVCSVNNVLQLPLLPSDPLYLRRVIALPGERVTLRKGVGVFLDGKLLEEASFTHGKPKNDAEMLSELSHKEADGMFQAESEINAPIIVPEGTVFVLPDNRRDFVGSDSWGFVELSRVDGTVTHQFKDSELSALEKPKVVYATEKIALNDKGVRALEAGKYLEAIHHFEGALRIDPDYDRAKENLGIAYNNFAVDNAKQPEKALMSLHKALYLDPANKMTQKNLASILKRIGRNPQCYEDRVFLAEESIKANEPLGALIEYREALRLKPNADILAKVSELDQLCARSADKLCKESANDILASSAKVTRHNSPSIQESKQQVPKPKTEVAEPEHSVVALAEPTSFSSGDATRTDPISAESTTRTAPPVTPSKSVAANSSDKPSNINARDAKPQETAQAPNAKKSSGAKLHKTEVAKRPSKLDEQADNDSVQSELRHSDVRADASTMQSDLAKESRNIASAGNSPASESWFDGAVKSVQDSWSQATSSLFPSGADGKEKVAIGSSTVPPVSHPLQTKLSTKSAGESPTPGTAGSTLKKPTSTEKPKAAELAHMKKDKAGKSDKTQSELAQSKEERVAAKAGAKSELPGKEKPQPKPVEVASGEKQKRSSTKEVTSAAPKSKPSDSAEKTQMKAPAEVAHLRDGRQARLEEKRTLDSKSKQHAETSAAKLDKNRIPDVPIANVTKMSDVLASLSDKKTKKDDKQISKAGKPATRSGMSDSLSDTSIHGTSTTKASPKPNVIPTAKPPMSASKGATLAAQSGGKPAKLVAATKAPSSGGSQQNSSFSLLPDETRVQITPAKSMMAKSGQTSSAKEKSVDSKIAASSDAQTDPLSKKGSGSSPKLSGSPSPTANVVGSGSTLSRIANRSKKDQPVRTDNLSQGTVATISGAQSGRRGSLLATSRDSSRQSSATPPPPGAARRGEPTMIETAISEVSDNFSRFVTNVFGGQKQVTESRRLAQKDNYIVVEQEKKIDQDVKPKTEKNEVPVLQKSQKKLVVPAAKPISPAAKQKESRTSSPNLEKVNQSPLESLMNID